MKILVVDDSRLLRSIIQKDLTIAGYAVVLVGDGDEGLQRAADESPDLILLDMMLPKTSGLDVLRQLKKNPATRGIPVVVLTGLSKGNEEKLTKEGAAGFCEKSEEAFKNNSAILIQTVKRVLGTG